jgi:16S rRNA (guanine966-N2)-methyltransferase
MRIIGGVLGGRRISPPARMPHTRPTTDRAREALFNILSHRLDLEGIKALDLFAGTGSIGYELCSRGASRVVAVEKDPAMHGFIRQTASGLALENHQAVRMDVFQYLEGCSDTFDLILADPPYELPALERLPKLVFGRKLLAPDGYLVVEHGGHFAFPDTTEFILRRNYGDTFFSFFHNPAAES